jgi:hypothetical protein
MGYGRAAFPVSLLRREGRVSGEPDNKGQQEQSNY